jgi:hypothetical protein
VALNTMTQTLTQLKAIRFKNKHEVLLGCYLPLDKIQNLMLLIFLVSVLFCASMLVCPVLPVSLDCPFLIAPLVFSNVRQYENENKFYYQD